MQIYAWYITLFFVAVLFCCFGFIFFHSGNKTPYEGIQKKGYNLRRYIFISFLVLVLAASIVTLQKLPYEKPASAAGTQVVIQVTASQFNWDLSTNQVKVGQLVEFDVTSKDVNHDFGLYNENMEVVAQTQAMPDYTNKLYYTFTKPGKYKILCMEYCGVAHQFMMTDFEVLPDKE